LEPSRDERALVSLAAAGARRLIEALPYPALLVALDDTLLAHNEPALALFNGTGGEATPQTFRELSGRLQMSGRSGLPRPRCPARGPGRGDDHGDLAVGTTTFP